MLSLFQCLFFKFDFVGIFLPYYAPSPKRKKKYIFLELHDMSESEDILVPALKYFLNI
jgi:hypothetical protein